MTMAAVVAMAVKVTESAALPLAKRLKKLEIFPPGQAATKNMPKAILGCGFISITNKKVKAGSKTNCDTTPRKAGLGCSTIRLKSFKLSSKATPNMTKPKLIFMKVRLSSEKFSSTSSILAASRLRLNG